MNTSESLLLVVQILKSETILLFNNYRPTSLVSNTGKTIKKLMNKRLSNFGALLTASTFSSLDFYLVALPVMLSCQL